TPRSWLSSSVVGGTIFTIGGQNSNGDHLDVVESMEARTEQWMTRSPLPVGLQWHTSVVVVGGHIVVCGGWSPKTAASREVFVFDPRSNEWNTNTPMNVGHHGHTSNVV